MTLILMLLLKSLLVFACAGASLLGLRRASAAARHLVCLLTLVSLLALPLFSLTLPGWHLPLLPQARVGPTPPQTSAPPETGRASEGEKAGVGEGVQMPASLPPRLPVSGGQALVPGRFRIGPWLLALYLLGVLLAFFRPLLGLWGITRLHRLCTDANDTPTLAAAAHCAALLRLQTPRLCRADVAVPMTWGGRRPVVLLPTSSLGWPEDRQHSVLLHEMAHIKRRDWSCHRLADLVCALYWFHPLVWLTARRLRTESELACDDLVLASGVAAPDYARHLLEIASTLRPDTAPQAAIAMAQASRIEGRLKMILDKTQNRQILPRRFLLTTFVLGTAAVVPLALLQPTAKAQTASDLGQSPIGNAAVQLVGIMDATVPHGNGWNAEGKALSAPFFTADLGPDGKFTAKPGQKALFFAFHQPKSLPYGTVLYDVAGTTLGGITMTRLGRASGEKTNSMSEVTMRGFQMQQLNGPVIYGASFPASLTHTNIRVGRPAGTWITAMTVHYRFPHGSPVLNIERGSQDVFTSRQGQIVAIDLSGDKIKYTFPAETPNDYHIIRFVAVDKRGRDLELSASVSDISGSRKQATARLPQNLSQFQQVRVEARPFVWAELKNVALQPLSNALAVTGAVASPQAVIPPQDYNTPWTSQVTKSHWQPHMTYHFAVHIAPGREGTRPDPPVMGTLVYGPGTASHFSVQPWKPGWSNILTVKFDYTPVTADRVHPDIIHLLTKQGAVAAVFTYYSI